MCIKLQVIYMLHNICQYITDNWNDTDLDVFDARKYSRNRGACWIGKKKLKKHNNTIFPTHITYIDIHFQENNISKFLTQFLNTKRQLILKTCGKWEHIATKK